MRQAEKQREAQYAEILERKKRVEKLSAANDELQHQKDFAVSLDPRLLLLSRTTHTHTHTYTHKYRVGTFIRSWRGDRLGRRSIDRRSIGEETRG